VLGIDGSRFTINRRPVFLLGFSYYGALGAPETVLRRDLDEFQRCGFNWLRVWATWNAYGADVSAVDAAGKAHPPYLDRLRSLVADCDHRGLIVDVTLTRHRPSGPADKEAGVHDLNAHARAITVLVDTLKPYRNWYLDLANERDVGDARFVPVDELRRLRNHVRELDPQRLVTASFGGHDLSAQDVRDALLTADLDFLAPHRPRHAKSPGETEAHTRELLARVAAEGRRVPVLHQEPFRRGYGSWNPAAEDFLLDLRGAVAGGAAGWCFHNGSERKTVEGKPRRSFDLRTRPLLDQLDPEERRVVLAAAAAARR